MGGTGLRRARENDELRHMRPPTAGNVDPHRPLGEPWDRRPRRGFPPETYAGRHVGRKESGKRAERERKESGKRAGGRDGELSARLRRDEHFGDTCGGSGLELPIARPYGSREIQGDREEVMTREKNVLILGAPRSKVRLPSTPGGNAGPKKGAPKEETS